MMKRSIGIALAAICVAMEAAQGTTYTWRHVAPDWGTATNWTTNGTVLVSSTVPGASDTAKFQNNSNYPPVISDARSIYGVDCSVQQNNMTIGGSGTLTIGGGGIVGQNYNTVTFTNTLTLNLSASQPWRPTSGRTIIVQSPVTGTGDITNNIAGDANCVLKYGGAPSTVTGATFTGNLMVNGPAVQRLANDAGGRDNDTQFWLDFGTIAANTTATFGRTAGATPGTITLNGAAFYIAATASSGAPIAECNNPLAIASGGGALLSYQKSGAIGKWSGAITLGGPLYLACDLSGSSTALTNLYTGTISLKQDTAGRLSIANLPGTYTPDNITVLGAISDIGSGFRNPLILHCNHDTLSLNGAAANMTYTNGTVVESCGSYSYYQVYGGVKARIDVANGSKTGMGNLTVLPGGVIRLLGPGALAGTATLQSGSSAIGVLGITNNALSALTAISSDSSGVLALENGSGTFAAISDLSALGNGRMFLGSVGGGTFTGTALAPGLDNKYRLGGGGMGSMALNISNSVLSGTASLQVGQPKWQGSGQVILNATNTFTGDIDVYSMPVPSFNGPGIVTVTPMKGGISSLVGQNVLGGNALGNTNGAVHLHCGNLSVLAANGTGQKKGALDFEGGSSLTVNGAAGSNYLTLASMARNNRGTLFFDFANKVQNTACRMLSTSTPPVNNGIMDAWGCWVSTGYTLGPDFATYDTSTGVWVSTYGLLSSPGSADAVVTNGPGNLPGGTCSAYALKVNSAITGTGTIYLGNTNKSSVAGLILGANVAPDVNFGGAEGMIIGVLGTGATLSGKVSGTNGITIAGCASGFGAVVALTNTNNDFIGQITVNNNELDAVLDTTNAAGIGTSSLGPVTNPILLNGGILGISSTNTVLNSGRTITLGVCGGTLNGTMTVAARITGTGTLMLCPVSDASQTVTITGTNNDYQGGTRLMTNGKLVGNTGATLIAPPGATLGTGDLNIDAYRTATLQGTNNVAANAMIQANTRATVNFQGTNNVAIGGLSGSGDVVLGNSAKNDTSLIVGGGDRSSTFYGRISEASATTGQGRGSLVKTGNGTFTLFGNHTFTGTNTINQGALVLMGSLASNVVVNSGGTLGGIGTIGGALTVNSGASLAVTLRSDSDYDKLTVAGSATLNGSIAITLAPGYTPAGGMTWTILNAGSTTLNATTTTGFALKKSGNNVVLSKTVSGTVIFLR